MDDFISVEFKEDLQTISFMHNGEAVDARTILIALANGSLRIEYEAKWHSPNESVFRSYLVSERWTLFPAILSK